MVQERETGTYEITTTGTTVTGPGSDVDVVVLEVEKTAYLTKLEVASENAAQVNVEVRDQDGTGSDTKLAVEGGGNDTTDLSGDVTNPLVKVPAGQELAVVTDSSTTGRLGASVTLQELAN